MHKLYISCLISTVEETETELRTRVHFLSFFLAASQCCHQKVSARLQEHGKSSLSDHVTNSSLELRWKSWIDALVEGGKPEYSRKHGKLDDYR
jgi:hypothetical protein